VIRRASDSAFMAFIMLASIYLWLEVDTFPTFPRRGPVDSDFWPKIVLGTLAVLAALYLAQTLYLKPFWKVRAPKTTVPEEEVDTAARWAGTVRLLGIAALTFAYFMGLQYLGFVPSTVVFLLLASLLLPLKRMATWLLFAPLFTAALKLFFTRALSLPLPRGTGVFYQLSLLLH
jgi:putative tricarboxylic transport membrane protein